MNHIPADLYYTEAHEWVRCDDDGTLVVGITEHAQLQLGEIVSVELPDEQAVVHAADEVCSIESAKTAIEIYSPVSGKIIAVNDVLEEAPGLVNSDPYDDGWFFRIAPDDMEELEELLRAEDYKEHLMEQPED